MSELKEQAAFGDSTGSEKTVPKADSTQADKILDSPIEIRALRKLQLETKYIQREFFKRVYELEVEFQKKHELVYNKRRDIINGICAPTTEDVPVPQSADKENEATPGVPQFWSNVLSCTLFEIRPSDQPILRHLTDVRATNRPYSELGFILEFDFSPNEYFENETLTKEYFYTCALGNEMVHQGPEIYKSVGCEIKWKEGKTMPSDSFFNFFRSQTALDEVFGNDDTILMRNDFEMGYFIKERIIPRAVLYYNENHCIDANSCSSFVPLTPSVSSMLLSQTKSGDDATTTTPSSASASKME